MSTAQKRRGDAPETSRGEGVDPAPDESASGSPLGWKERLLPVVAAGFIRLLRATVRLRFHGDDELRARERRGERYILTFWHRHLLLMQYAYGGGRMSMLISASRDGELIARTIARFGHGTTRGSSSRGGAAALRQLLRRARAGDDLGFTPDGPRGPAQKVQPGVIAVAAATGLPLQPVAYAATRAWELRSWDRFVVPQPGSTLHFVFAPLLYVARDAEQQAEVHRLEAVLDGAQAQAERLAGRSSA